MNLADEQLQYNLSHLKRPQYVSDESNRLGKFSDLSENKADLRGLEGQSGFLLGRYLLDGPCLGIL